MGEATQIQERVSVLGGLVNMVLGNFVPVLSVFNPSVNCGGVMQSSVR